MVRSECSRSSFIKIPDKISVCLYSLEVGRNLPLTTKCWYILCAGDISWYFRDVLREVSRIREGFPSLDSTTDVVILPAALANWNPKNTVVRPTARVITLPKSLRYLRRPPPTDSRLTAHTSFKVFLLSTSFNLISSYLRSLVACNL
mmetsp:Transcript_31813/g.5755  ORF Transcript_31813/g.5755 Transcript_31813/m.5755 type:complete len:147 (-) Transcript_31813:493-933(-)